VNGPEAATPATEEVMSGYKDVLKRIAHQALDPLVRGLLALGLKADHLTALGFMLSLVAGLEFALGQFQLAAAVATVSGICDILDGQVARIGGRTTRFGAFLDSTLDRVAEAALFVGISWYYTAQLVDMAVNPSRVLTNLQHGLEPVTFAIIASFAMLA